MTRYRQIHCCIWTDDKFPYASDDCQLIFFHLLTTPQGNQVGIFNASIEGLAAEKRWPLKRYSKAFDEALHKGFIKYDAKALLVLIPHFIEYNPPASPKVVLSWPRIIKELPSSYLKNEWIELTEAYIKDYHEAFHIAFRKVFAIAYRKTMPIQEQEQEQERVVSQLKNLRPDADEKNPDNLILSKLLHDLILKNNPKAKQPNLNEWASHIDKMHRIDKRPYPEIEKTIRWCQSDSFWCANILSTKKLREKYDQLVMHSNRVKKQVVESIPFLDETPEERRKRIFT